MVSGRPFVSLVCPTYNRPELVRHACEIFVAQTYDRAELIVVDDSDRKPFAELALFPRVRHIKLGSRVTMGEKHNIGMDLAQGEVLGYQDDDDWFAPTRLSRQLQPLVLGLGDVVGIPRDLVLEAAAGSFHRFTKNRLDPAQWLGNATATFKLPFHDGTAIYARSAVRGFRHPDKTMNEKADFLNRITDAGARHVTIENGDLFVYVRHGSNTWRYRQDLVHVPASRPSWFAIAELDFYRRAAA